MANTQNNVPYKPKRIFYGAGLGDAIGAHNFWKKGEQDPSQVSVTFSSQVEQYCADIGAELYLVGSHPESLDIRDGNTRIEQISKSWPGNSGAAFHIREALHGLRLLKRALAFRADTVFLESGCTQYFMQGLFALFGMRVFPILHNALWPGEKRPSNFTARLIQGLDSLFWRYGPAESLCVSPVSAAQIKELGGPKARPTRQFRAQFNPTFFDRIKPLPDFNARPFRINFVGRIVASKGVFHLLQIAREIENQRPGAVKWTICGSGPDLDKLRAAAATAQLGGVVNILGWTAPDDQIDVYSRSHCSIIPSIETEGLPMSAIESLLAGRPIIASNAALTLDALSSAAVVCRRGDVGSYVQGILRMIDDPGLYDQLAGKCSEVAQPFINPEYGLTAELHKAVGGAGKE